MSRKIVTCALKAWHRIVESDKSNYRAFHRFGQAKFAYSGSTLGLKPIYTIARAASKSNAQFKSGQNWL